MSSRLVPLILASAAVAAAQTYVSPSGDDANPGTQARPVRTLERARDLARTAQNRTVNLAAGTYRLSQTLVLDNRDSGTSFQGPGSDAPAIISGGVRITGWRLTDRARNVWSAPAPAALTNARQIYVDGVRATRTRGRVPWQLTMTATGYTIDAAGITVPRNPPEIEFVYTGGNSIWSEHSVGLGSWTEPRCPVAIISGTAIIMAQPCWDNSTKRIMLESGRRTANLVGPATVGKQPTYMENAFELLGTPGQFYFDRPAHTLYYMPRRGEDLATADVEAPLVETLISGEGTADAPVHDIGFTNVEFSYAAFLRPSGPEGFSEIQANYTLTGPHAWATQGLCKLAPNGECPYGAWTRMPGNVAFRYGHDIRFRNDAFLHLGAAGLDLGDGAVNDLVEGCAFTDISGNGLELGAVDTPLAPEAARTRDNAIRDNHIWNIGAEFRGGIGIVVGYSQRTRIEHNQIDHTPYAAISMGWGGWPDKIKQAGQANYSENNVVADNRIFQFMLVLADGGGIYTQGLTGPDLARGEKVTGNVITDQLGSGHGIYTDNGSCNITVSGNVMFHLNHDNWGSRHADYYNGADGKTRDPLTIADNWWQQGDRDTSRDGVTENGNRLIDELAQVPRSVLDSAGLEPEFRSLLDRRFGKPTPPGAPSRVAVFALDGSALVTWSPPTFEGGSPVESYAVTAPGAAPAKITAADFWKIGYVRISGLTNGKPYAFTVQAINANGTSEPSMASLAVTPGDNPLAKPGPPANVRVLADANGIVSIHFQAPPKAEAVTAYTFTVMPGNRQVTFTGRNVLALGGTHTTFSTVGGLTPGETYTISVTAVNPAGAGEPAQVTVSIPK
jgi:hypothetical protein